ncbi:hypothetical protein DFH27DRAFT_606872 [Peziza echinospora]|nr:hypothetical protein DFH27DRAFT_606872 [Peziza echinospora]
MATTRTPQKITLERWMTLTDDTPRGGRNGVDGRTPAEWEYNSELEQKSLRRMDMSERGGRDHTKRGQPRGLCMERCGIADTSLTTKYAGCCWAAGGRDSGRGSASCEILEGQAARWGWGGAVSRKPVLGAACTRYWRLWTTPGVGVGVDALLHTRGKTAANEHTSSPECNPNTGSSMDAEKLRAKRTLERSRWVVLSLSSRFNRADIDILDAWPNILDLDTERLSPILTR